MKIQAPAVWTETLEWGCQVMFVVAHFGERVIAARYIPFGKNSEGEINWHPYCAKEGVMLEGETYGNLIKRLQV
jgi:hypothetical protein